MCAFRARARYRPAWWTTILTEGMWGHSVPKYKFQWNNLPAASLRVLCRELGFPDEDPADLLRAAYGARPTDAFVQEVWPLVRKGWLPRDTQLRKRVVEDLWALGLGTGEWPTNREAELAYLAGRNSTKRLRRVVLDAIIAAGEIEPESSIQSDAVEGTTGKPDSPKTTATLDAMISAPIEKFREVNPVIASKAGATRSRAGRDALTLAELESRLWSAANALRGPVDPADFKTYTFPMLFWKWISDTWDYERAQAVGEYGVEVEAEVEQDYHRFNVPKGSHWRDVTTKTDNVGSQIATALGRIEQANPDKLAGIFGDAA